MGSKKQPGAGGGYTSSWIRKNKRVAIYLRDGLCCVYCGAYGGAVGLTLDHLNGRDAGNEATNLVTCCRECNLGRRHRPTDFPRVPEAQPLSDHLIRAGRKLCRENPAWLQDLFQMADPRGPVPF